MAKGCEATTGEGECPPREVDLEIEKLLSATGKEAHLVRQLTERLMPVLRVDCVGSTCPEDRPLDRICPVAGHIRESRIRTEDSIGTLSELLMYVEV